MQHFFLQIISSLSRCFPTKVIITTVNQVLLFHSFSAYLSTFNLVLKDFTLSCFIQCLTVRNMLWDKCKFGPLLYFLELSSYSKQLSKCIKLIS